MPERPPIPLTGGCPCGGVRYEIGAFPLLLYACHCTDCQRESGSAFAMNMPVATGAFRITHGAPKPWRRIRTSGVATASWFCADCSGRIYGERVTRPESVNVRAGTLDDTSWVMPVAHFFMRSAQKWEVIGGDSECFEMLPTDRHALTAKWRQIWSPT